MSSQTRNRKSTPCRLYNQGHCRFGDKCKFSHDANVQHIAKDTTTHSDPASTDTHDASDARPRSKRGEIPCRAWKAGTCTRGTKCRYRHDIDKPCDPPHSPCKQRSSVAFCSPPLAGEAPSPFSNTRSPPAQRSPIQAKHALVQEDKIVAARERANVVREEAAKTIITQVIFGSIVTYSAGLDVSKLITGFETCTLRLGNLPLDVKEGDIQALLRRQGLDAHQFHLVIKKRDRRLEARVVTDATAGRALALGLDGIDFQEETLVVEMSATNSLEGMNAATGQSSEILTISFHAPSARYIAEYTDAGVARAKVGELNRSMYGGRRIKVEMNTPPRGRFMAALPLSAVRVNNLPPSVMDEDVLRFTSAVAVRRLPIGHFGIMHTVEEITRLIRDDIERAIPGGLKKLDNPPDTCNLEGVVSARAHFSSWEEAHAAYACLSDKRYGHQTIWLRLPDPMYFTLVIPAEQYNAQKAQWSSLSSSIKDRKACVLNVRDSGNVVVIRLSGSVKEATGALKVRVENLARGDKVEGWHRSLGVPNNSFVSRVYSETGAFLRADWKRQSLKVYGTPSAVDQARNMIKNELDRLSSLDYTVTLPRYSVGFFLREGVPQLKEALGENNVRFASSSRKITVSGGEEARHALDRLITLSHKGSFDLPNAPEGDQTCPICYDDVSSPHQLGCGHMYCVACLRHFISSALESDQLPLTCLGDEARCRVPIAIPTIQQFLPPASFNRLLEAAFDAYIAKHPEEFKYCKTADCTQIYRAVRAGTAPQTLHCPSCFSAVCNACHEDGHDGLSCAESKVRRDPAEQERLNDVWITSQNGRVKKCPQCSVLIEKLEGCNHMTCRCGAHICWRCMGVFSAETIYPHMHSAHGTIHGDAPAVPVRVPQADIGFPVDLEEQRELLRQAEARRTAALRNVVPAWYEDYVNPGVVQQERARRAAEEQERRLREQRRLREAAERERLVREHREAEQRQERGGWGCMIM